MFTMKKGLQEANHLFAKHRSQLLSFAFGWAIIAASSLYFSYIYGFSIVVIIFILLPLELSLVTISKKMYDKLLVENKDFYVGFRALMVSISLHSKIMLRGFLWAILAGFIVSVIGSVFVFIFIAPHILALGDYQALLNAFLTDPALVNALMITSIVAFFVGGIVYNLKSTRGQMAPFILFDTGFDIQTCYTVSTDLIKKDKKLMIRSKLAFYAYYVAAVVVGFMSNYFLAKIPTVQLQYAAFIGFLVTALLIAPIHILSKLYYNALYSAKYKEAVKKRLQDFLNVRMRVNQQQFFKPAETKETPVDKNEEKASNKDDHEKE